MLTLWLFVELKQNLKIASVRKKKFNEDLVAFSIRIYIYWKKNSLMFISFFFFFYNFLFNLKLLCQKEEKEKEEDEDEEEKLEEKEE